MSTVLVVLIASISGVMGIFVSKYMDSQYTQALVNYGNGQGYAGMCYASLAEADCYASIAINSFDQGMINDAVESYEAAIAQGDEYMAKLDETLIAGEAVSAFEVASQAWEDYKSVTADGVEKGVAALDGNAATAVFDGMLAESEPLYQSVKENIGIIIDIKTADGAALSTTLSRTSTICMIISIALILLSLVAGYIVSRSLKKTIADPVAACADRLNAMANGDLHSDPPAYNKNNEIGDCVAATKVIVDTLTLVIKDTIEMLTEMSQGNLTTQTRTKESYRGDLAPMLAGIETTCLRLNDTLLQINEASDQVDSGSDQVSSGAQALSQGATEQASSVEELAATVNEISQNVNDNAENATQVQGLADDMGVEINNSNDQMESMMAAMTQIESAANDISKVLKTIEDIAFQTNILALNAAVEAARAGAAGKGFAVVADEVRNLAAKSDEAAKSTTVLIDNALAAVNNGAQIATNTANSMASVVSKTQEVVEKIDAISAATQDQAEAISQVTQGIDQISSVVQTNSATAEESAAASEELAGQASLLKTLVAAFKLSGASSSAASDPVYSEPAYSEPDYDEPEYDDPQFIKPAPAASSFTNNNDKY